MSLVNNKLPFSVISEIIKVTQWVPLLCPNNKTFKICPFVQPYHLPTNPTFINLSY